MNTANLFEPRTFSTDWEVMVLDKWGREVDRQKLTGFSGQLSDEFDLKVETDWNTIEFSMGIHKTLAGLWERIQAVTNRASQLVRAHDLEMCPVGSFPTSMMFNAAHIHIGTLRDEAAGIRMENGLVRWIPVFAALAANSPLYSGFPQTFKSWRVERGANHCIEPPSLREPSTAQATWGTDGGHKLYGAPTMEVRVTDCAGSRRFLAEMATFTAAWVHTLGTRLDDLPMPDARAYEEYLTNRWSAARWGMQATFAWGGTARPVAEIVGEMLDEAADALTILGTARADLGILQTMREKRLCQADFALSVASRYPDPVLCAEVLVKRMRDWNAFDIWLCDAAPLEPVPLLSRAEVLDGHLAHIGEGTHFFRTRETMHYPGVVADGVIAELIESGKIVRNISTKHGQTLSRVA